MNFKNIYITKMCIQNGEFLVEAHDENGFLVFGFKSRDYWGWKEKAIRNTPSNYIPVFHSHQLAKVKRFRDEFCTH